MKIWLIIIVLLFLVSCSPKSTEVERAYSSAVGIPEPVFVQQDTQQPDCKMAFVNYQAQINGLPSPTSNLKYVTQSHNIFEVKYGDGMYITLSKDTSPIRISCTSGNSMLPTFDCDDNLIMKSVDNKDELNVGDIILFRKADGSLVIHRIFDINETYQTKADNPAGVVFKNNKIVSTDERIQFSQIMYKVVGIIY